MPFSYRHNQSWRSPSRSDASLQTNKVKFQVSLKTPLQDKPPGSSTL
jgi:hypothetical protein